MMLSIVERELDEVSHCRQEWNALLARSDADPLFLSYDWIHSWWKTYGSVNGRRSRVFIALDAEGRWVGLVPFYTERIKYKNIIPSTILTMIGSTYRSVPAVVSEYPEIVVRSGPNEEEIYSAMVSHVFDDENWDEIYLSRSVSACRTLRAFSQIARRYPSIYFQKLKNLVSYQALTHCNLQQFKDSIGRHGTKKLFENIFKLRNIDRSTRIELEELTLDDALSYLDSFQFERFGEAALTSPGKEFLNDLNSMNTSALRMCISGMKRDGVVIAVSLDIESGDRRYNLQSGFSSEFSSSTGLGFLLVGLLIEHCINADILVYDLLEGGGRSNSNYKSQLTNLQTPLETVRICRSSLIRLLRSLRLLRSQLDPPR